MSKNFNNNNGNTNTNNTLEVFEKNPTTNAKILSSKFSVTGSDLEREIIRYLTSSGVTGVERVVCTVDDSVDRGIPCIHMGLYLSTDSNAIERGGKSSIDPMYRDFMEERPWRIVQKFEKTFAAILPNNYSIKKSKSTGGVSIYMSETDAISLYMGINTTQQSDYAAYIVEAGYNDGDVQIIVEKVDRRALFKKKKTTVDKYQKDFENTVHRRRRY